MRTRTLTVLLLLSTLLVLAPRPAEAAEDLVVGVKEAPPFVMRSATGEPRGFSVDLVREIAARLDPPRSVSFDFAPDLATHLADAATGKVELAIAATSVTAAREKQVDFSNPFFRDALDVVVPERGTGLSIWDALLASDVPEVLLALLVFVVGVSHLVWLLERGRGGFARGYFKGVGEGIWWTVVTMSTVGYGDFVPKTSRGRGLAVAVIFVGIVMFGIAVASLTAAATTQQLVSPIERLSDLAGLRVVSLSGSTAEQELARRGVRSRSVTSTGAGLEAVRSGAADAFVHDRAQLLHALSESPGQLVLVNRPFVQQSYAIAFPLGSPLRKEVNVALQRLREGDDAPYDAIFQRWFPSQ